MGTRKTYALFTISQDNKIDEIYDCGKYWSLMAISNERRLRRSTYEVSRYDQRSNRTETFFNSCWRVSSPSQTIWNHEKPISTEIERMAFVVIVGCSPYSVLPFSGRIDYGTVFLNLYPFRIENQLFGSCLYISR